MFFFVWFFVPETKGKPLRVLQTSCQSAYVSSRGIIGVSLEHMDKLFGVTEEPKSDTLEADEAPAQKAEAEVTEKRIEHRV
jgi:hypothetical protein